MYLVEDETETLRLTYGGVLGMPLINLTVPPILLHFHSETDYSLELLCDELNQGWICPS